MFSTCLFCHASLGANEVIEHFPVGRRLAFDGARGRLWVVCRKCERWNLSPLEERWEAIEECERLFRDTRLRVSTDNIGLARAADGLELVRIGAPQRPEMAAWRYGDQFGRRRRKHLMWTGAGFAAVGGIIVLGPVTGIIAGSTWGLWNVVSTANTVYQQRRVRARLVLPEETDPVTIRLKQLSKAALVSDGDTWALRVAFDAGPTPIGPFRVPHLGDRIEGSVLLRGTPALSAAGRLLPAINRSGANRSEVDDAVKLIGRVADPSQLFERYAGGRTLRADGRASLLPTLGHPLSALPKGVRLALEMATHEESERRALEGELAVLEAAWKEAEEIAAIADDLFVSDETRERLATLKSKESS